MFVTNYYHTPVHTWGLIFVWTLTFGIHMEQRDHAVFFRNACKMQIVCMISILRVQ